MPRKIFKAVEVKEIKAKVLITPPQIKGVKEEIEEPVEEVEEVEELKEPQAFEEAPLPSVEDEREKLLEEAKKIKEDAEAQAKKIKEEAEEAAFKVMQKNSVDARKLKEEAEDEVKRIHEDVEKAAHELEQKAKSKVVALIQEAKLKANEEGREDGFNKGKEEVERLIDRLHTIFNAAIDKRKVIVESTEKQLVDLVMLIARKVVKVISEAERKVVIENIKEALKR